MHRTIHFTMSHDWDPIFSILIVGWDVDYFFDVIRTRNPLIWESGVLPSRHEIFEDLIFEEDAVEYAKLLILYKDREAERSNSPWEHSSLTEPELLAQLKFIPICIVRLALMPFSIGRLLIHIYQKK